VTHSAHTARRLRLTGALVAALLVAVLPASRAELLPTSGTFEGIYHRDRFGVGRFGFFIVHPSLHPKLAEFEGRYIRVEVAGGAQPYNPGPAVMTRVGKIVELPQPPVRLELTTVPHPAGEGQPCQVLLRVGNAGQAPLTLRSDPVTVALRRGGEPRADVQDTFGGYRRGQFAAETGKWQLRSVAKSTPWRRHHILGHPSDWVPRVTIQPGETFPFCLALDKGLAKGQYEIAARLSLHLDADKPVPVAGWLALDVPTNPQDTRPQIPSALRLRPSAFRVRDEWTAVDLRLTNGGPQPRWIPQCTDNERALLWLGRLHGTTREGKEIPLTFSYPKGSSKGSPEACTMARVPPEGLQTTIEFRPESAFSESPVARLTCEILTDRGLETFVLADAFTDRTFAAPPPFGTARNGLKVRIRTHRQACEPKGLLRIYWQLVNLHQKPLVLRSAGGWRVEIDGRTLARPYKDTVWGWAMSYDHYRPEEHYIDLRGLDLAPGDHTVKLFCRSVGGHYKNANGKRIPAYSGTVASNVFRFTVAER